MRGLHKLTSVAVAKFSKPGRHADGGGLYLQIRTGGTKTWAFRFMRAGKARQMGLGALHTLTLAKARERATECRRLLLDGHDPIAHRAETRRSDRTAAQIEAAKAITFRDCAERYIAAHEDGWRNKKHSAQWKATLTNDVYPVLGTLPVGAIDVGLVLKVLEPIWRVKPETAARVRGRIESVLDWAAARLYRTGENPARWRGHLDKLLPARSKIAKVQHHAALPYAGIAKFMTDLRSRDDVAARALEFTILTASRTSEAIGVRSEEIDFQSRMWTVPADRMKGGREHRVPLSDRAFEILETAKTEGDYFFPGRKPGTPLSNMALLMTLRRMGRDDLTTHGFRSTFRDWGAEVTAYPTELLEMAIAHAVSDKVEAAYRRGDMIEKRRRLMADWATYCASPPRTGNVVPLRGGDHG